MSIRDEEFVEDSRARGLERLTGILEQDYDLEDDEYETPVKDLLTDILHVIDEKQLDLDELLERARRMYEMETTP